MKKLFPLMMAVVLLLSSCEFVSSGQNAPDAITGILYTPGSNLDREIATAYAQTQAAGGSQSGAPATARPQAANTASGPVSITTIQGANCRGGPGTVYDIVEVVVEGTTLEITGRDNYSDWFQVTAPGRGSSCWLVSDSVNVNGNASSVAVVAAPPTPYPAPDGRARRMQIGQSVTGAVTLAQPVHYLAFWATQGQTISISISGDYWIAIQLDYPAIGGRVARSDESYQGYYDAYINNYIVTGTGWHYLLATSWNYFTSGCNSDSASYCTGNYTVRVTSP